LDDSADGARPSVEVEIVPLFDHFATRTGDSTGDWIRIRGSEGNLPVSYDLCHFTNVCLSFEGVSFQFSNYDAWERYAIDFQHCFDTDQQRFLKKDYRYCGCFHLTYHPRLLPYAYAKHFRTADLAESANAQRLYGGDLFQHSHFWSVHKWVSHHHIAHWAQKLLYFSAIYQYEQMFSPFHLARPASHPSSQARLRDPASYQKSPLPLPLLDGIAFHDSSFPMTEHEEKIFNFSLTAALDARHALFREYVLHNKMTHVLPREAMPFTAAEYTLDFINAKVAQAGAQAAAGVSSAAARPLCFSHLTMTPTYAELGESPYDLAPFRAASYRHFGFPRIRRCPPRRAVLITREDRAMLNRDDVIAMVKAKFNVDLEVTTVTGKHTSRQQAELFASSGLILAPHSSQLINVMFSHPGQVIIEVAPELYNMDFSQYARTVGVYFVYALGGTVPNSKTFPWPEQVECLKQLAPCDGDPACMKPIYYSSPKCKFTDYPNKNLPYTANVTQIQHAITHAMHHLDWLCYGRWSQRY
jgi:hypothetical protein